MKKLSFPCIVSTSGLMGSVIRENTGVYIAQNGADLIKICEQHVLGIFGFTFFDFDGIDERNRINFVAGFSNEDYGDFSYYAIPLIPA